MRGNQLCITACKDQIHWGQIIFETLLQAVTLGFGSKLTDAAVEKVAGVAVGTYSRPALRLAVEAAVQGSIAVLQSTARALFDRLQGVNKPMTVSDFLEQLAGEFAQGALFHAIMSTASHEESGVPGWRGAPEGGGGPRAPVDRNGPTSAEVEPAKPSERAPAKRPSAKSRGTALDDVPPAILKEDAIAKKPTADGHEVVVTKQGVARCSPSPCPVIHVEFAKELEEFPRLKEWNERVEALRKTDPEKAAQEGEELIRSCEAARSNAAKAGAAVGTAGRNEAPAPAKEAPLPKKGSDLLAIPATSQTSQASPENRRMRQSKPLATWMQATEHSPSFGKVLANLSKSPS